jgi:hypothetical protein
MSVNPEGISKRWGEIMHDTPWAPDLRDLAPGPWATAGAPILREWPPTRAYLRLVGSESGPWFAFDFDQQGLIKSAMEQAGPPK